VRRAAHLVCSFALLALLAGFIKNEPDPYALGRVEAAFMFDGVRTTVTWRDCGVVNAYYYPAEKTVVMCNELKGAADAGTIRFILAHELSHSVIMQLEIPYTTHHEGAADELAALMLIWIGMDNDVWAAAEWWWGKGRDEDPADDHYGDKRRALNLACLVIGSRPEGGGCTSQYRRAVKAWNRLLGL
jgi:hypothetical protein